MKRFLLYIMAWLIATCAGAQEPLCPSGPTTTATTSPAIQHPVVEPRNPEDPQPVPQFPNDRLIFWIHGLGGNIDSWARAAQATQYQAPGQEIPGYPARKVTSLPLSYSEFSLSGAASTLHNMLMAQGDPACVANHITDKTTNFIIAHSQGGIVSRATDQMYDELGDQIERRFGGIVTFGTAHAGALVINNKDQFGPFAAEACSSLIAGPLEDAIQNIPILDFFVNNETFQNIANGLCQFMGEYVAPIALRDQLHELTEDYKVGAAPLAELNAHNSGIPRVAFYGVEEEPVFYRTMYSLKVKSPNEFGPFQADNDQPLVDHFNQLLNEYQGKYETYLNQLYALEAMGMPCDPLEWIGMLGICTQYDATYWKTLRKKDAWLKGYLWLKDSNTKFKTITGASQGHWVNTYQCSCNGYSFPTSQPSCPPGCSLSGVNSYWKPEEYANDGIILAASAMAYPGAMVRKMNGSNHLQMRNDSNTRLRLSELFEGAYGDYFTTQIR